MKKTKNHDAEILEAIRYRVIGESENLKQEKERLLEEKITLEALEELTDLPRERIEAIACEVKEEYRLKDSSQKTLTWKERVVSLLVLLMVIVPIGFAVWGVAVAIVNTVKENGRRVEYQRKADLSGAYWKLIEAASSGNLELVEYLTLQGTPVHIDWWEHDTALMAAVKEGKTQVIGWLLAHGADITYRNKNGKRASDLAGEGTYIAVKQIVGNATAAAAPEDSPVRTLWKQKLPYTKSAFLGEVADNKPDTVSLFLEADNGRFVHDWEYDGLQEAARQGYVSLLGLILANRGDLPQTFIHEALLAAASAGQLPAIDFLLAEGADINYSRDGVYSFRTPLICALEEKNAAAAHLLARGADPDKPEGDDGMPPVTIPIYYGDWARISQREIEQVKLLIRYEADVNRRDEEGRSPLDWALRLRWKEGMTLVKILKAAGAEIPLTEENFRRFLKANDAETVRYFLEQGAAPDLQGFDYYDKERTALMEAAAYGYTAITRLLLEKGADANFRTSYNKHTALYLAVYNEHVATVRLLLQYKAAVTQDVLTLVDNWAIYTHGDEERKTIRKLLGR